MMRTSVTVGLSVAVMVLAGCGSGTQAGDKSASDDLELVNVATIPVLGYIPFDLARERGFLEDVGIEVEATAMPGGVGTIYPAMQTGSIDISISSPGPVASANQKGADLRAFCGNQADQNAVMLAAQDSPWEVSTPTTWQDAVAGWKGSVIGIPTLGGAPEVYVKDLVRAAGLDPDRDIDIVAVGAGDMAITAVEQGKVDFIYGYPFLTQQAIGRTKVVFDWLADAPELATDQAYSIWVAPRKWLDANEPTARAFCGAMERATEVLFDDDESVQSLLEGNFHLQGEALTEALGESGPLSNLTTDLTCNGIQRSLTASARYGQVQEVSGETGYCDLLLWDKARTS